MQPKLEMKVLMGMGAEDEGTEMNESNREEFIIPAHKLRLKHVSETRGNTPVMSQ